jgi:predicted nucleic acid-binding protein
VTRLAFDTSAAIPLLVRSHTAHATVRRHAEGRTAVITAHSLAETYSVLTRLPGDARVTPADAARLLRRRFEDVVAVPTAELTSLPDLLGPLGIAGGAVYDALVGLAARAAGIALATRDARALGTYAALGTEVEILSD